MTQSDRGRGTLSLTMKYIIYCCNFCFLHFLILRKDKCQLTISEYKCKYVHKTNRTLFWFFSYFNFKANVTWSQIEKCFHPPWHLCVSIVCARACVRLSTANKWYQHYSTRCNVVCVCRCVCCNLSSRSCFPGLRWGKAALAAGRFISGTGAQNKEKMIDWMMNYLEVEGWEANQPCWRERGREG